MESKKKPSRAAIRRKATVRKAVSRNNIAPKPFRKPQISLQELKPLRNRDYLKVIRLILSKGKSVAREMYGQNFFFIAKTPDFMKKLGFSGEGFTVSYGVISNHITKDSDHELNEKVWEAIPSAIVSPFAITKYYYDDTHSRMKGYRIYTVIPVGIGYVVVGVDVKNMARGIDVNSLSTVFARNGGITQKEEVIYKAKNITPQQDALLIKPNS